MKKTKISVKNRFFYSW